MDIKLLLNVSLLTRLNHLRKRGKAEAIKANYIWR